MGSRRQVGEAYRDVPCRRNERKADRRSWRTNAERRSYSHGGTTPSRLFEQWEWSCDVGYDGIGAGGKPRSAELFGATNGR